MSQRRSKYNAPKMRLVLGSGATGPTPEHVEATRKRSLGKQSGLSALDLYPFLGSRWRRKI